MLPGMQELLPALQWAVDYWFLDDYRLLLQTCLELGVYAPSPITVSVRLDPPANCVYCLAEQLFKSGEFLMAASTIERCLSDPSARLSQHERTYLSYLRITALIKAGWREQELILLEPGALTYTQEKGPFLQSSLRPNPFSDESDKLIGQLMAQELSQDLRAALSIRRAELALDPSICGDKNRALATDLLQAALSVQPYAISAWRLLSLSVVTQQQLNSLKLAYSLPFDLWCALALARLRSPSLALNSLLLSQFVASYLTDMRVMSTGDSVVVVGPPSSTMTPSVVVGIISAVFSLLQSSFDSVYMKSFVDTRKDGFISPLLASGVELVAQDMDLSDLRQLTHDLSRLAPESPRALLCAHHYALRIGDLQTALVTASRAVTKCIGLGPIALPLAVASLCSVADSLSNQSKVAVDVYTRAWCLFPADSAPALAIARLHMESDDQCSAEIWARETVSRCPLSASVYHLLAAIFRRAGSNETAIQFAVRADTLGGLDADCLAFMMMAAASLIAVSPQGSEDLVSLASQIAAPEQLYLYGNLSDGYLNGRTVDSNIYNSILTLLRRSAQEYRSRTLSQSLIQYMVGFPAAAHADISSDPVALLVHFSARLLRVANLSPESPEMQPLISTVLDQTLSPNVHSWDSRTLISNRADILNSAQPLGSPIRGVPTSPGNKREALLVEQQQRHNVVATMTISDTLAARFAVIAFGVIILVSLERGDHNSAQRYAAAATLLPQIIRTERIQHLVRLALGTSSISDHIVGVPHVSEPEPSLILGELSPRSFSCAIDIDLN